MTSVYTLSIYKKDQRFKSGERLIDTIDFYNYTQQSMNDEYKQLQKTKYRPEEGYRIIY